MRKRVWVQEMVSRIGEVLAKVTDLGARIDALSSLLVAATRRDLAEPRHVSVMLLGVGMDLEPVMLAEGYSVEPNSDFLGELEPMIPIAPGAWLVVVGAPFLKQVTVGRDLQVGNVGNGSPVVRLKDTVLVGQRIKFVVSWKGKER